MVNLLVQLRCNNKNKNCQNVRLSKPSRIILSKQLPYLDVNNNALTNEELISFFSLSTVIKVLSKKGNEAERYLLICQKLSKEFLIDDNISRYFYPNVIKEVVVNSNTDAESRFVVIMERVDKILMENYFLNKYCSKKLISKIVARKGQRSEEFLREINDLLAGIFNVLQKKFPGWNSDYCSEIMIKVNYFIFTKEKTSSLRNIKNKADVVKDIIENIDWDKYFQLLLSSEYSQEQVFKKLFDKKCSMNPGAKKIVEIILLLRVKEFLSD